MARPSKLTEKQWAEIQRRYLAGEKVRALAREFGVSEGAIRARVVAQCAEIKEVAHQIVATEERFSALPVSAQVSARTLANELREISSHLASAAKYGAMTAHRLSSIAHQQTDKIDEAADINENAGAIKAVMALTRGANDAATIGLNLLAANKDQVKRINESGPTDEQGNPLATDIGTDPAEAAKAYLQLMSG